jgi:hypothetical protein
MKPAGASKSAELRRCGLEREGGRTLPSCDGSQPLHGQCSRALRGGHGGSSTVSMAKSTSTRGGGCELTLVVGAAIWPSRARRL